MTSTAPPVREVVPAHWFDPAPLEAWLGREVVLSAGALEPALRPQNAEQM